MVEINKRDVETEIKEELTINDADLETELKEQSIKFFFRGSQWAKAIRGERQQKLLVEQTEAELSKEFRELRFKTDPTTRITEKMLKEFINGHPKYKEAQQKLIQLGYVADLLNVVKSAFESRGRMLLEMARSVGENKFYEKEFHNMEAEFIRREDKKAEKRKQKINKDVEQTE
jgi:hypothetical protein